MIKNIIFDFGNVLFNLDLPQMVQNIQDLFSEKGKETLQLHLDSGFFKRYETGQMSSESFVETLRRCDPDQLVDGQKIIDAWNSCFLDFPKKRLDKLLELRNNYTVILLSNINDLHLTWITAFLEKTYGITDFENTYFDHVFYSHLIEMRKPHVDIYAFVLQQTGIIAEESVFFDDLKENIEVAEDFGIQGEWHAVERDILEHLESVMSC